MMLGWLCKQNLQFGIKKRKDKKCLDCYDVLFDRTPSMFCDVLVVSESLSTDFRSVSLGLG